MRASWRDRYFLPRHREAQSHENQVLTTEEELKTWKIAGHRRGRGRGRGPPSNVRGGARIETKDYRHVAVNVEHQHGPELRGKTSRGGRGGFGSTIGYQSRDSHNLPSVQLENKGWPPLDGAGRQGARKKGGEWKEDGPGHSSSREIVPYQHDAGTGSSRRLQEPSLQNRAGEEQVQVNPAPGLISSMDRGKGLDIRDNDPQNCPIPVLTAQIQSGWRIILALKPRSQQRRSIDA
ncbi:hypothetical protein J5N97_006558 [Dioscorea zingiberensis]|uniref:Uncharacterized protein n=1 Tax=Dioscorea zingiberensis TaxID=325984 RepID=A0A9D5HU50_9LILI|nr:hypothetical protein J5N97_006558 [Dioscorea zingiberensis]